MQKSSWLTNIWVCSIIENPPDDQSIYSYRKQYTVIENNIQYTVIENNNSVTNVTHTRI